jgi:hypothetical protein
MRAGRRLDISERVALTPRRGLTSAVVILSLSILGGCSSSGTSSSTASGGPCPFSGSIQTQTQGGKSAPTAVTKFVPQTQGCIDQVKANFSPTQPPVRASYQKTTPVLVVEFQGAKLGSGITTRPVRNPKGYLYVKDAQVSTTRSGVTLTVTLDQQRPFLISTSQVPPYFQLAIGATTPEPGGAVSPTVAPTTLGPNGAPPGAIAKCNDGTYAYSETPQGACPQHGGVAIFYG